MHKVRVKSAHFENFKGFQVKDVEFGPLTIIKGSNGQGKTTIAEGIMWCLFGVGNDLTNNPKVRREVDRQPVNDVPVTVELALSIDDKDVVVKKTQKRSVKKDGSYSDDNTYSINGVEKTLRDFQAYFDFSMSDLLMCMNTEAFLDQKPKEMRDFLFKLPGDISVKDIVMKYPEFSELASMLDKYSIEEIAAMNKASITKLNKEIAGYPGRIDEVSRQIVSDVDTAELELQKNALAEQIADIEKQEEDSFSQAKEYDAMSKDIMDLQFKKTDIEREANAKLLVQRQGLQKSIDKLTCDFNASMNRKKMAELEVERLEKVIASKTAEKEQLKADYIAKRSETVAPYEELPELSASDLICPTCGQVLPEEIKKQRIAEHDEKVKQHKAAYDAMKNGFEVGKNAKLQEIGEKGKALALEITNMKEGLTAARVSVQTESTSIMSANEEKTKLLNELNAIPAAADLSENQEYTALVAEIQKKEEAMQAVNTGADYRSVLKQKKAELQEQLDSVKNQISRVVKNSELEERIEFLRQEHAQKEQAKADCERVLDMLDSLDMKKNELLVDDINAHFGGRVTWDLFAFAKNGGYKKDYCEPCIDGYLVKDTANKGRRIEAKMIIALSVQKIVGIQCPIILDDAESLDSWRLPTCSSQLIVLSRTDDRELNVEVKVC